MIPQKLTREETDAYLLGCRSEEEDLGNAAADEQVAAVAAADDAPLASGIESSAAAALAAGAAAKPAASGGGRACKLRDVLARVAVAEACIAQHASQEAPVRHSAV